MDGNVDIGAVETNYSAAFVQAPTDTAAGATISPSTGAALRERRTDLTLRSFDRHERVRGNPVGHHGKDDLSGGSCDQVFSYTTVNGVVPGDTVAAAINIARYPAQNVSNLLGLAGSSPPFLPRSHQPAT